MPLFQMPVPPMRQNLILPFQEGQLGPLAQRVRKEPQELQAQQVPKGILAPEARLERKVQQALPEHQQKCKQPTRAAVLWFG